MKLFIEKVLKIEKNDFGKIYNLLKNIWEDKEFKNDILIDNKKRGDQ